MPFEQIASGLTVEAGIDRDEGVYVFRVELEGVDVVISQRPIGHVEPSIEAAKAAAANQNQPQQ